MPQSCECTPCNCPHQADEDHFESETGTALCEDCADYTVTDGGDVICSRMTQDWTVCHQCKQAIEWGGIETQQWKPNSIQGNCGCGEGSWLQTDEGGWKYHYSPPA